MGIDPAFCRALCQILDIAPLPLGELAERIGEPLDSLLPRLAVLLHSGRVSLAGVPGRPEADRATSQAAAAAFNERALARITSGEALGWLLSPLLLQPVPITPLEAFYLPLVDQNLEAGVVAQLVAMGIGLAGGRVMDSQGRPLEDPALALEQLANDWKAFLADRVPELRRLAVVPPAV